MANAFDDRRVTLGIQTQDKTYSFDQRYFVRATGSKLQTGGILGEAEIRIDTDLREHRREADARLLGTLHLFEQRL